MARPRRPRARGCTGRETLLDLCTGTADVALAAVRPGAGAARVVGVDFSPEMLRIGHAKVPSAGRLAPRGAGLRRCHLHPVAGLLSGRRHHCLWHPERPGHGGGMPRTGTRRAYRADVWRCSSSACRAAGPFARLYLWYFASAAAADRAARVATRSAYEYLPESVGAISAARRVRPHAPGKRVSARECRPFDVRHRLPLRGRTVTGIPGRKCPGVLYLLSL